MELKFKKLKDRAIMPIRAFKGDAGLDITATDITIEPNEIGQTVVVYHSDLAVEIPEGYVGLLFPRSSIAKKSLLMSNGVGVIDSGYRGELMAKMRFTTDAAPAIYKIGEKFAQLVIVPIMADVDVVEATELSKTERGEGGYGSSDNKLSAPENTDNTNAETGNNNHSDSADVDQQVVEGSGDDTNVIEVAE